MRRSTRRGFWNLRSRDGNELNQKPPRRRDNRPTRSPSRGRMSCRSSLHSSNHVWQWDANPLQFRRYRRVRGFRGDRNSEVLKRRGIGPEVSKAVVIDFLNSTQFRNTPSNQISTRLSASIAHAAANGRKQPPDDGTASDICSGVSVPVGDKWSLLVIFILKGRPAFRGRFSDLKRSIPGISQRMLTATVRNLERDGMLTRHVYAEVPPRVEYELTPLGRGLTEPVLGLVSWLQSNWPAIRSARDRFDARKASDKNGRPARCLCNNPRVTTAPSRKESREDRSPSSAYGVDASAASRR